MRRTWAIGLLSVVMAACDNGEDRATQPAVPEADIVVIEPAIIPAPRRLQRGPGFYRLDPAFTLATASPSGEAEPVADYLTDLLHRASIFRPHRRDDSADLMVRLDPELSMADEAYRIDISDDGIQIAAARPAGLFYGAVSLWQILTSDARLAAPDNAATAVQVPHLTIEDSPAFQWRGLMLDSARHVQPTAFIKDLIDWMALHKLNTFHWHLTDDQGWRLEIDKYPRLTDVGAWRVPAGDGPASDIDPDTGQPRLYGGYYTQDEVREVVAYAARRFVTIVPEIDMPGHAQAAIVAYPRLGVDGKAPDAVSGDWGIFPSLFNVEPETFAFLEDVLVEVMELFPGPYIHIGGDEAVKDQWRDSAGVQQRMAEYGVADEEALQGYFTRRMDAFLTGHGRRLIGWDEILEGGLSPNATVMSWRGVAGGVQAAALGHDAIMSPWPVLYFDHRQGASGREPPGRGRVVTLQDVYAFDPYPNGLVNTDSIIGVQANVWTEHIRTTARVEHMTFPRAAALAEVAWTPAPAKDWPGFLQRLVPMLARYQRLGIDYAPSAFAPRIQAEPADGATASVSLSNQVGWGEVRYTLDGADPQPDSRAFDGPIPVEMPGVVKAATFRDGVRIGPVVTRDVTAKTLMARSSHDLRTCSDAITLSLEDDAPVDGPRAVFLVDIMNPCWIYPDAPLSGVVEIEARVGQVPFNFQVGSDVETIPHRPPTTPHGELEARAGGCDGPVIATLPLAPAAGRFGVTTLRGRLDADPGRTDVCFTFTADRLDPFWVLDHVRFIAR